MLCENCGKKEANVRYEENINGRVRTLNLCEECSKKLGIGNIDFNMPIDFSSFFGEFLEDFSEPDFMPLLNSMKSLKCNTCGYTFDDIINNGKLGCSDCYDVFSDRLDPIIKKIQGANRHVGRIGKVIDNKIDEKLNNKKDKENIENMEKDSTKNSKNQNILEELQEKLKDAIKDERYEDAAKLRDEIKKLENK